MFEKLKHEQVYWAQQELTHCPVYSREELISRIEFLDKETDHNKVYPLIKLAGRILARFNKFHEMASKYDSIEKEIQALEDEDWLLQKYQEVKQQILKHYRNNKY
jgi:hypothetical protein|nr:MAG TPA: hypothetical protein [Caudoviricetes sp.]